MRPLSRRLKRWLIVLAALLVVGIAFAWTPLAMGGSVTATFEGPDTPEAALHVLRGSLQFVFEASGTTGTVGAPEVLEVSPQRTVVRYLIRWP